MTGLRKQDWAEIAAALTSKINSAVVGADEKWIKHLKLILRKIGPDGIYSWRRGVAPNVGDNWWTVLLLYPDYMANTYGQDSYLAWVPATSSVFAVLRAKQEFKRKLDPPDPDFNVDDLFVIAVFRGKHKDQTAAYLKFAERVAKEKNVKV
jgi:hypothetical protein